MTLDTVSETVTRSHGNLGNAILEPELSSCTVFDFTDFSFDRVKTQQEV